MKKILIALFTLLLLVGCSEKGYSQLSNGNDVIFKGPDMVYTKNDLYKSLKLISEDAVESDILAKIAENLEVDMSDVEEEADEMIELYRTMGYESAIISYYGSIENYRELYINSSIIVKLDETYIEDNFDSLTQEDKPIKMQLAYFNDEESANQLIEKINNGSTFESAAAELGFGSDCSVGVYLDSDSALPIAVKSYLNETATTGVSSVIVSQDSTTDADGNIVTTETYYVLNIVSRDANEFKDEYVNAKLQVIDDEVVKEYLFNNHEIKFFDQDIYEMMKAKYEVLK